MREQDHRNRDLDFFRKRGEGGSKFPYSQFKKINNKIGMIIKYLIEETKNTSQSKVLSIVLATYLKFSLNLT